MESSGATATGDAAATAPDAAATSEAAGDAAATSDDAATAPWPAAVTAERIEGESSTGKSVSEVNLGRAVSH